LRPLDFPTLGSELHFSKFCTPLTFAGYLLSKKKTFAGYLMRGYFLKCKGHAKRNSPTTVDYAAKEPHPTWQKKQANLARVYFGKAINRRTVQLNM
jgi:hypothetical protein